MKIAPHPICIIPTSALLQICKPQKQHFQMSTRQDKQRLQTLQKKYKKYFDKNKNLNLPDTLQWKKLEDDEFFTNVIRTYALQQEIYQRDAELQELLGLLSPRKLKVLGSTVTRQYRNLPKACKFPGEILEDEKIKFYHDGKDDTETDFYSQVGLVVGNHKFSVAKTIPGFEYDSYAQHLKQFYYKNDKPPKCVLKEESKTEPYLLETRVVSDMDWAKFTAASLWEFCKSDSHHCLNSMYPNFRKIAADIENGTPYCLMFSQLANVLQFMRNTKFASKNDEFQVRSSKLFGKSIYVGKLDCSSNCPSVKYHVTLDFRHNLSFIALTGQHTDKCHAYQQRIGYPLIRNLLTKPSQMVTDVYGDSEGINMDAETMDYYGIKEFDKFNMLDITEVKYLSLGKSAKKDMDELISVVKLGKCFCGSITSVSTFQVDESIMVETFKSSSGDGIVMGSKDSIKLLAEQPLFNISFIRGKVYKDFNIVTVSFEDINTRKAVLGCVGFLRDPIVPEQFSGFLHSLKTLVYNASESPFVNLKHIVTEDEATVESLTSEFPEARVVESLENRRDTLFQGLDGVGKIVMFEAMFERNPLKCLAKIDALIYYYNKAFSNPIFLLLRKNIEYMLHYVENLKVNRAKWCYSFREILPDKSFVGNARKLIEEVERKTYEVFNRVVNVEELGISEQVFLKKSFKDAFTQTIRGKESPEILNKQRVKELISNFEKIYEEYKDLDVTNTYGLGAVTTTFINEEARKGYLPFLLLSNFDNLFELFNAVQDCYKRDRYFNLSYNLVKTYKYSFVKKMSWFQEDKFNEAMRMYNTTLTKYEIRLMKERNIPISEDICGCNKRAKSCVPCQHMLHELYEKCERKALSTSKSVNELFEQELKKNEKYEQIVERKDPNLNEVLDAREKYIVRILQKEVDQYEPYDVEYPTDAIGPLSLEVHLLTVRGNGVIDNGDFNSMLGDEAIDDIYILSHESEEEKFADDYEELLETPNY